MCGIFAAVKFNGFFDAGYYNQFQKLTDLVNYRGPDNRGFYSYNTYSNEISVEKFSIFLGHRRLSIIDLSENGNQPLILDDLVIIFNGEIFNYLELQKELTEYKFQTKSDTETILKIYQKYGEDGFSKLNGMWSFILFDKRKNKVIISRDRFSIKPLFYYKDKDTFYFASEIKQLLPLLNKREINQDLIFKFIRQGLVDHTDNTFFNNIFKIPPKTNLVIDLNNADAKFKKYWDYEVTTINSEDEALTLFYDLFYDSIRIRLRSDVGCGGLLSGGLDSSALCLIADSISDNKFQTYSVISDNQQYNEEKFIDILVSQRNLHNKKLMFDTGIVKNNLPLVIKQQDEPFGSFSIIAQYSLLKLIKENTDVKVILTGQGGDELLLGYLKYYFFNLKLLAKENKYPAILKELFYSFINRTVLRQFDISSAKRYLGSNKLIELPFLNIKSPLEPIWGVETMVKRQILDLDSYSIPNLNRYDDRNSMAHSIETRTPFLDHRLVNLSLGLKSSMKIQGGWMKYILRKGIPQLPAEIAWRRDKKNFSIPEYEWIKNDMSEEIKTAMSDSLLHKHGIIDKHKFLEFYASFRSNNRMINYTDISRVYIAELWCKEYFGSN